MKSQFLRFCLVGGISTSFNYGFFFLLYDFGINYLLSSASGYILGVFMGFILNKHFTFKSKTNKYTLEVIKYFIVYTISLFLGLGFLRFLVYLQVNILLANVFSIALTTLTNYTGCKFFVFTREFYSKKINFLLYRYKYLIRYMVIGVGSIFFEVLLIGLIRKISNSFGYIMHPYIIISIGFLGGVVFSFILNSRINFPVPKNRNLRTFRVFLIISTFSFLLNLILMKVVFERFIFMDYNIMRFVTAAIIFMISYTLHRRFTFIYIKEVGVAIYMKKYENIPSIKSKIGFYPDFIHIDLVDKSYNPSAEDVDLSKGAQITKEWPLTKKMMHIMSKHPSHWIKKVHLFSDFIIFHVETKEDVNELIKLCRSYHKKVGISIFYQTNIDSIIKYLNDIDLVQVLGVPRPGHSSQNLDQAALEKLNLLNNIKDKYKFEICFDGGVKLTNINKINAKYVVSASTILKADDAVKAIYDLKTSSRYYVESEAELKKYLTKEIKRVAESLNYIKSATLVGSFSSSEGMEGISDVDIVIIIDNLTKDKFDGIVNEFNKLNRIIKIDYDYDTIMNTKFGPLKFNRENTVVLHLMIYDIKGHIKHCIESPFTCLDWQHSNKFFKMPMESIFNVTSLQPNYFFNARRSINDYLNDLLSNKISYREYKFGKGDVTEVKKSTKMENKDKFEFSYHIIKFCMSNFMKLHHKDNTVHNFDALIKSYFSVFPSNSAKYIGYLAKLIEMKNSNNFHEWGRHDENTIKSFLNDFKRQFDEFFENNSKKAVFIRHQKTHMNEQGIFLGQKSDPSIIKPAQNEINNLVNYLKDTNPAKIYSSPLKRCIETAELIKKSMGVHQIILHEDLIEIDYGEIDGKSYRDLKKNYPKIAEAWSKSQDPRFPGGENTSDVLARVNRFLSVLSDEMGSDPQKYIIFTHNVFLRCLVGSQFGIPKNRWHLINILYMEPIELLLAKNSKFYINLTREQIGTFFKKALVGDKWQKKIKM